MPRHERKSGPWYAIRERRGPRGIAYRVSLTRHGTTVAQLFRSVDHGTARGALKAARTWRDVMARALMPETKQEYAVRLLPHNTSGCPGVCLRRTTTQHGGTTYEYVYWQAQTPDGVKPFRSRSFSIARYGSARAFALAVEARAEFVALALGYVGLTPIPKAFHPFTSAKVL